MNILFCQLDSTSLDLLLILFIAQEASINETDGIQYGWLYKRIIHCLQEYRLIKDRSIKTGPLYFWKSPIVLLQIPGTIPGCLCQYLSSRHDPLLVENQFHCCAGADGFFLLCCRFRSGTGLPAGFPGNRQSLLIPWKLFPVR